jgi:general secretion pathway protein D
MTLRTAGALGLLALGLALASPAWAQPAGTAGAGSTVSDGEVQLDFNDVELSVVIDTIARLTGKNFIYDDRVRGRVTIVSPTKITVDEAYAVFESVLQVKGFTTVQAPGGAIKVIPLREAKESNVETVRGGTAPPTSDRFITRLIPLRYIDAEAIAETLKPLVSKDASLVAYAPTNTVILTDAATNISRILSIVQSIDVETFKEELSVIELRHADAGTMAQQLSEIFGAEVGETSAGGVARLPTRARRPTQAGVQPGSAELATKGQVRIITDERTNSLIVLASRPRTAEIRDVVTRLDVPVKGGGRIHVYYLKYADAEELANTISALLSGQPAAPTGGGLSPGIGGGVQSAALGGAAGAAQALRSSISELAGGVTVTADPPTNSLLIQASQEGFNTLSQVIAQLDIPRPSVLVEALIMEVDVTDSIDLGFSGLVRITSAGNQYVIGSLTDTVLQSEEGDTTGGVLDDLVAALAENSANFIGAGAIETGSTLIQGLIRASATVNGTNILSAPHVLTLDNEEAEIKVGDNIPIISSRVQSAAGIDTTDDDATNSLATSQNIERQDIGITLRVTPQISEGDTLRLEIFQEVTAVNEGLTGITGSAQEVGVALSNRKIENVVTVSDEETVVIGGLIDEIQQDQENKVPWLGDVPILGWLFKTTGDSIQKRNLLVFLTPHIIRNKSQHAQQTVRKREEFWASSEASSQLSDSERAASQRRREEDAAAGIELPDTGDTNPVRSRLESHRKRYPVELMRDLEARGEPGQGSGSHGEPVQGPGAASAATASSLAAGAPPAPAAPGRWGVLAATYADEGAAAAALQQLIDAGHDGALVSEEHDGTLLYEVRLGPYADQVEAERTAAIVRDAFRLAPTVYVEEPVP